MILSPQRDEVQAVLLKKECQNMLPMGEHQALIATVQVMILSPQTYKVEAVMLKKECRNKLPMRGHQALIATAVSCRSQK